MANPALLFWIVMAMMAHSGWSISSVSSSGVAALYGRLLTSRNGRPPIASMRCARR